MSPPLILPSHSTPASARNELWHASPRFGTPHYESNRLESARRRQEMSVAAIEARRRGSTQTDGSFSGRLSAGSNSAMRRPNPLLVGRASVHTRPPACLSLQRGSMGSNSDAPWGAGGSPSMTNLDPLHLDSTRTQLQHWQSPPPAPAVEAVPVTVGNNGDGTRQGNGSHQRHANVRGMPQTPTFCASTETVAPPAVRESASNSLNEERCFRTVEFEVGVDTGEFDTESLGGSTCEKVEALCDKAQNLIYEMSAFVTPPVPPPTGELCTVAAMPQKPHLGQDEEPLTPPSSSGIGTTAAPVAGTVLVSNRTGPATSGGCTAEEELADVRFRINRIELELNRIQIAGNASGGGSASTMVPQDADVNTLRKQVEATQTQLGGALAEMREMRGQMSALTQLMGMLPPAATGGTSPSVALGALRGPVDTSRSYVAPTRLMLSSSPRAVGSPVVTAMPYSATLPTARRNEAPITPSLHAQLSQSVSADSFIRMHQHPVQVSSSPQIAGTPPPTVRQYSSSLQFDRPTETKEGPSLPPPKLTALLQRLGEHHPSVLNDIVETAASPLMREFLQECMKEDESEGSKKRQNDIWCKLGETECQNIKQACLLAECQQDDGVLRMTMEEGCKHSQNLTSRTLCQQTTCKQREIVPMSYTPVLSPARPPRIQLPVPVETRPPQGWPNRSPSPCWLRGNFGTPISTPVALQSVGRGVAPTL